MLIGGAATARAQNHAISTPLTLQGVGSRAFADAVINSRGEIAFVSEAAGQPSLYTYSSGVVTPVNTSAYQQINGIALDDQGTVYVNGEANNVYGTFKTTATGVTLVGAYNNGAYVSASGQVAPADSQAIASNGVLAGVTTTASRLNIVSGPAGNQTVFAQDVQGIPYVLENTTTMAVNSSGTVAFVASYFPGGSTSGPEDRGVFDGASPQANRVATTLNDGFNLFGPLAINDAGTIVFQAQYVPNNVGPELFTGSDAANDLVVGHTTSVDGSPIYSAQISGANALNADGDVVFVYATNIGVEGIGIATPTPEPTAAAGLLVIGGSLLSRRRRRQV